MSLRLAYAVLAAVVALMYVVPYTVLEDPGGWGLYLFWSLLGVLAMIVAWVETRGWGGGG